jgi:hypothetical protein
LYREMKGGEWRMDDGIDVVAAWDCVRSGDHKLCSE